MRLIPSHASAPRFQVSAPRFPSHRCPKTVASETSNIHVGKLEGSVEEWQMADPVDGESVLQDHHGRQGKVSSFRIGAHHTGPTVQYIPAWPS